MLIDHRPMFGLAELERLREQIAEGTVLLDIEGEKVGQVKKVMDI